MLYGSYRVLVEREGNDLILQRKLFECGFHWNGASVGEIYQPNYELYEMWFKDSNSEIKTILFGGLPSNDKAYVKECVIDFEDFMNNFDEYMNLSKTRSIDDLKLEELKEICEILNHRYYSHEIISGDSTEEILTLFGNANNLFDIRLNVVFEKWRDLSRAYVEVYKEKESSWIRNSKTSESFSQFCDELQSYLAKINI